MIQIPILTYHAANISGSCYKTNDLVAFSKDLQIIHNLGYKVIPLKQIALWLQSSIDINKFGSKLIGISFDDGLELEFNSKAYLNFGIQKSVYSRCLEFLSNSNIYQPHFNITSFVIASPTARKKIDKKSLSGQKLMSDKWWKNASQTKLLSIENHSWDHNHPDVFFFKKDPAFKSIDTFKKCKTQIVKSQLFISNTTKHKTTLFAYPWGEYSEYLVNDFFPNNINIHKHIGAFTCEPAKVTQKTNPWKIPRFVCGNHWKSEKDLKNILTT